MTTQTLRDGTPLVRDPGAFEREIQSLPPGYATQHVVPALRDAVALGLPEPLLVESFGNITVVWPWDPWRIAGEVRIDADLCVLELTIVHADAREPEEHEINLLIDNAGQRIYEIVGLGVIPRTPLVWTPPARTVARIELPLSVTGLAAISEAFTAEYGEDLEVSYTSDGAALLLTMPPGSGEPEDGDRS